jgi:DNA-binding NarL/FixJ family response regulator
MAQPVNEQVLIVDDDARVRAALAALIDATPGLQVAAAIGSTADAVAIGRFVGANVAIIDVHAGQTDDDFATIRELAEHLTVIAVGNAMAGGIRALEAGAIAVCDQNGDSDALTATVEAAARCRPARARTTDEVRAGEPAPLFPKPRTS